MAESGLEDGDDLLQVWNVYGVLRSVFTSIIGAFAAVQVLDHGRWRKDDELLAASPLLRHPQNTATVALGLGAIWCMHFLGMAAEMFEDASNRYTVKKSYNSGVTAASAIAVLVCLSIGFRVACSDIFAGSDRVDRLRKLLLETSTVKDLRGPGSRGLIYKVAYFSNLQHLAGGALITASGVCVMHYIGMVALRGQFAMEWRPGMVVLSIIIAVVVSLAGFWILFRLLLWNGQREFLRPTCAVVIAAAVCSMHYTGMMSVRITFDSTGGDGDLTINKDGAYILLIATLCFGYLVQWSIACELRAAYNNLKAVNLQGLFDSTHHGTPGNSSHSKDRAFGGASGTEGSQYSEKSGSGGLEGGRLFFGTSGGDGVGGGVGGGVSGGVSVGGIVKSPRSGGRSGSDRGGLGAHAASCKALVKARSSAETPPKARHSASPQITASKSKKILPVSMSTEASTDVTAPTDSPVAASSVTAARIGGSAGNGSSDARDNSRSTYGGENATTAQGSGSATASTATRGGADDGGTESSGDHGGSGVSPLDTGGSSMLAGSGHREGTHAAPLPPLARLPSAVSSVPI